MQLIVSDNAPGMLTCSNSLVRVGDIGAWLAHLSPHYSIYVVRMTMEHITTTIVNALRQRYRHNSAFRIPKGLVHVILMCSRPFR